MEQERQAQLIEIATVGRQIQLFALCFIELNGMNSTMVPNHTTHPVKVEINSQHNQHCKGCSATVVMPMMLLVMPHVWRLAPVLRRPAVLTTPS